MAVVELPAAAASLSDRVRVLRWGIVAAGEPRILSRQSPPPLYKLRDEGPPASSWAGPPFRARGQGTSWPLWRSIPAIASIFCVPSCSLVVVLKETPSVLLSKLIKLVEIFACV